MLTNCIIRSARELNTLEKEFSKLSPDEISEQLTISNLIEKAILIDKEDHICVRVKHSSTVEALARAGCNSYNQYGMKFIYWPKDYTIPANININSYYSPESLYNNILQNRINAVFAQLKESLNGSISNLIEGKELRDDLADIFKKLGYHVHVQDQVLSISIFKSEDEEEQK